MASKSISPDYSYGVKVLAHYWKGLNSVDIPVVQLYACEASNDM